MPDIISPELPEDQAGRIVKETLHRMLDFRAHVDQQIENHRQLLKFWEKQRDIINGFLQEDQLDVSAVEMTTPERPTMDYMQKREF